MIQHVALFVIIKVCCTSFREYYSQPLLLLAVLGSYVFTGLPLLSESYNTHTVVKIYAKLFFSPINISIK